MITDPPKKALSIRKREKTVIRILLVRYYMGQDEQFYRLLYTERYDNGVEPPRSATYFIARLLLGKAD